MHAFNALKTVTFATCAIAMIVFDAHARARLEILKSFQYSGDEHTIPLPQFSPRDGVIEGKDNVLYGTTTRLGPETGGPGAVFGINKDGTGYRVLHVFEDNKAAGFNGGAIPGKLIEGRDQYLYGVSCCAYLENEVGDIYPAGELFRLSRDGSNYNVLHRFVIDRSEYPDLSSLVQGENGSLYGTACCASTGKDGEWAGYIYELDGLGPNLNRVAMITNSNPQGLILGSDGAIYGCLADEYGNAVGLFRLTLARESHDYRLIYQFEKRGVIWRAVKLLEGSDGALYGTLATETDPREPAIFSVFRISKDGTDYRVLFTPQPPLNRGSPSISPLAEGADGFLYGGLSYNDGECDFFRISRDGIFLSIILSSMEEFGGVTGIRAAKGGFLYGTMGQSIFKLSLPEVPDLEILPDGSEVRISGQPGINYQLLRSVDLKTWNPALSFVMPDEGVMSWIENTTGPAAFFQAVWVP